MSGPLRDGGDDGAQGADDHGQSDGDASGLGEPEHEVEMVLRLAPRSSGDMMIRITNNRLATPSVHAAPTLRVYVNTAAINRKPAASNPPITLIRTR